jgi:hypothetical protein
VTGRTAEVGSASHRHLRIARNVLAAVFVVSLVVAFVPGRSTAAPVPGSQGVDTSLPPTDSQVTVGGRGTFSDLQITVNQTTNLVNQAISVTWTGGKPTRQGPGRFASDYLQIMQCWGEDDGSNPANPGPAPEQCEAGASTAVYGGNQSAAYPNGFSTSRLISRDSWPGFDPNVGVMDPTTKNVWRAFKAVDGTVIGVHTDPKFNPSIEGGNFWLNPYFNVITTNEVPAAASDVTGKGAELFQVATGLEAPGLGCGQKVEPVAGGSPKMPKCWLVIVPRGDPTTENAGTPFEQGADQFGVVTSPLDPNAWKNRIAVPLQFNPVDSPCRIGADERRIAGTELIVPAISSWQPSLCSKADSPPYVYATLSDSNARQQIVSPTIGSPGMAVTSRPIDPAQSNPKSPTVYAPVTLSGVVIGFNVERNPKLSSPKEEQDLTGVRVADLNLTPRLVAKLLTQSYRSQVDIIVPAAYSWEGKNPADLSSDPDFLQFNPEFDLLTAGYSKNFGGLMVQARNSDTARAVWNWILADPEAKAWLDGQADPWGMKVNPYYATSSANVTGIPFAADGPPESFPKSDPNCYEAPALPTGVVPPALCGTDWAPYLSSMRDGARNTRVADDGAKVAGNAFATSADQAWTRDVPQVLGRRSIMTLTDSASAALFGLQTARLSRAGDNGGSREFIAPTSAAFTAGVGAMKPSAEPSVLLPDDTAAVPGAYPLTQLTYASIRPLGLDATAREQYAEFLDYVAGPGQVVGLQVGQLPNGYSPLPAELAAQTRGAAETVRTLPPVPDTSPPPSSTSSPSSGAAAAGATGSARRTTTTTTSAVAAADPTSVVEAAAKAPEAGPLTPILALARSRFFIPALAAIGVIASLAALEITKRPRRATARTAVSTTGGTA